MFFDKRLVHTIDTHGVKSLCFKLKWETFGGHCFECGEWGHFMAECQRHCPSNIEVLNQENGKEMGEMLVSQILWLAWMQKHHLDQLLNLWIWKNKVWWL